MMESVVHQLHSDMREEEVDQELGKLLDTLDASLQTSRAERR